MTVVRNKTNKILSNTNINQFASTRTKKTYFQIVADRHDDVISTIEVNADYPYLMFTSFTNQFACCAIPNLHLEVQFHQI